MHGTWHGHHQAPNLVRENDEGEHYGDDTNFITLGVIVITYINSVGLLLFSTFGPSSGWLLV